MKDGSSRTFEAKAADGTSVAADVVEPAGGGATTLLLVPGLGYGPWSWKPQRTDLGRDHRLVLMHNRGTGRSEVPPGPYAIGTMADDAAVVLRGLGADRVHVVGTSMGGYISLWLAQAHPDLVASVVTVASSTGGPGALPVPEETAILWRESAHLPAEEFARRTMPLSLAPGWPRSHPQEYAALLAARLASPTSSAGWSAQSAACERFLAEGLPAAGPHQPVTAVHGSADRVVPYENLAALGRRLPHARLLTLEGAGHLCWLERPHDVNHAIRSHLARVGSAPVGL